MGLDSRWWLIDVDAVRADPTRPATFGVLFAALRSETLPTWARVLALPPPARHHAGLVLALAALWRRSPTNVALQQRLYRRPEFENGPPLSSAERGRLNVVRTMTSGKGSEWSTVARALGIAVDGAPRGDLVLRASHVSAVRRIARDLLGELPVGAEGWAAVDSLGVERDEARGFVQLLADLPEKGPHVLLTLTQ